jgi:NTP pyrophosphatase (non-canonical NTP hydrolase)
LSLKEIGLEAYNTARSKGWYDNLPNFATRIALIHSELSEALEADRKGDMDNRAEELADVIIRICDLAYYHAIDLDAAVRKKMDYNKTRPHMHGGKLY